VDLKTQTHEVTANFVQVRDQVDEGTHLIRKHIKKSSGETSQALQRLQWNRSATISEFLKRAGTLSEVTLQTLYTPLLVLVLLLQQLRIVSSKVSEIYNIILCVQTGLTEPDTRHTWLQDPMRFEDAYGRIFPIPAEFDFPVCRYDSLIAPFD
jgi:hypothetical protein